LLGLVALAVPVAAAGDRASPARTSGTVLALEFGKRGDMLVRLDRRTLAPTSSRLKLGGRTNFGRAFSPDGRRLAIGVFPIHGLRIVDVSRMKKIGRVSTPNIDISALGWLAPRRIVGYAQNTGFFAVDPVSGKVLRPPRIAGNIQAIRRAGNRLLILSGWPRWAIGFARLSVIDPTGRVRTVLLRRIKAGILSGGEPENVEPGLALDRSGRAFVVGGRDEPVAEVNLKTLAVTYHELPKEATSAVGRTRRAIWVGDGRIAVWGTDVVRSGPPDSHDYLTVGLSIVDSGSERSRPSMPRLAAWPSLQAPCWRRALAPGCGDTQRLGNSAISSLPERTSSRSRPSTRGHGSEPLQAGPARPWSA
jgi:hypothetical protein